MDMNTLLNIAIGGGIIAVAAFFYQKSRAKAAAPAVAAPPTADHVAAVSTAISNAVVATVQAMQPPAPVMPAATPAVPLAPVVAAPLALWPAGQVNPVSWGGMPTTLEVPIGNSQIFAVDVPGGAIFTGIFTIVPSNNGNYNASYQTQLYADGAPFGPTQTMLGAGGAQKFADMGAAEYFPRCAGPCRVEFVVTSVGSGGTYLMQFQQSPRG